MEHFILGELLRQVEFLANLSRNSAQMALHDNGHEASSELLGSPDDTNFEFGEDDGGCTD